MIVALALAAATFAFVVYPLFREEREEKPRRLGADERRLVDLGAKERAARAALEELEYDFASGQLAEGDYLALKEEYEERASGLAPQPEETGKPQEEDLEAEILRRRQSRREARAAEGVVCPRCGNRAREGDRVCSRCGAQLPLRCPKCGASYRRGDRFCARCAASLPAARSLR